MKHHFKEGEEVCHKENLDVVMSVSRILKESHTYTSYDFQKRETIEKLGIRMIGIECHWWKNSELQVFKFHSRELVPSGIAKQGKQSVIEFLENQNSNPKK